MYGELKMSLRKGNKAMQVTEENTVGEDSVLNIKSSEAKMETVFAESDKVGVLEVTAHQFGRVKGILYEAGLKTDFLTLEAILRKNATLKKNLRQSHI